MNDRPLISSHPLRPRPRPAGRCFTVSRQLKILRPRNGRAGVSGIPRRTGAAHRLGGGDSVPRLRDQDGHDQRTNAGHALGASSKSAAFSRRSPTSWRRARDDTGDDEAGLLAVLGPHNHKEENILYPMIDQVTDGAERTRRFLPKWKNASEPANRGTGMHFT
jgi:hypothetical protein